MEDILGAAEVLLQWQNLLIAMAGFIAGCIGGAIPGLGGVLTLTLMMPFVSTLPINVAMMALIGGYVGVQYAGSVPAILMNTPGSAGSAAATFDGYPMAQRGEGVTAITISAVASGFGSWFGAIFLIILSPFLIRFVLLFGSPEYFLLAVLGLATIVMASGKKPLKGLIAAVLGCFIASIGTSQLSAQPRYTMDIAQLYDGISLVAAFIGVFAIGEMMRLAGRQGTSIATAMSPEGSRMEGFRLTFADWPVLLKSSAIGVFIGTIPGQGATVANFLAWVEAKRSSKDPDSFGKGNPAGIVAVDASNNATIGGALVPTIAFGIPGGGIAAVLLVALILAGVNPGPNMFAEDIGLTYTMIGAVLVGGFMSFSVGVILAKQFSYVTIVPMKILIPSIITLSYLGAYVIGFSFSYVIQTIVFGVLGYFLIRFNFPIIALILGIILGPLAELNLHRSVQISQGNFPWFFFDRRVATILIAMIVFVLIWPPFGPHIKRKIREVRRGKSYESADR